MPQKLSGPRAGVDEQEESARRFPANRAVRTRRRGAVVDSPESVCKSAKNRDRRPGVPQEVEDFNWCQRALRILIVSRSEQCTREACSRRAPGLGLNGRRRILTSPQDGVRRATLVRAALARRACGNETNAARGPVVGGDEEKRRSRAARAWVLSTRADERRYEIRRRSSGRSTLTASAPPKAPVVAARTPVCAAFEGTPGRDATSRCVTPPKWKPRSPVAGSTSET